MERHANRMMLATTYSATAKITAIQRATFATRGLPAPSSFDTRVLEYSQKFLLNS